MRTAYCIEYEHAFLVSRHRSHATIVTMVNPFPTLLIYGIFAPFLIRIVLGTILLYLSVEHFRSHKEIAHLFSPLFGKASKSIGILLGFIEIASGGLLVVGAWTQFGALMVSVLALKSLFIRGTLKSLCPLSKTAYVLMLTMAVSLLLSGAGAFAFDLPL